MAVRPVITIVAHPPVVQQPVGLGALGYAKDPWAGIYIPPDINLTYVQKMLTANIQDKQGLINFMAKNIATFKAAMADPTIASDWEYYGRAGVAGGLALLGNIQDAAKHYNPRLNRADTQILGMETYKGVRPTTKNGVTYKSPPGIGCKMVLTQDNGVEYWFNKQGDYGAITNAVPGYTAAELLASGKVVFTHGGFNRSTLNGFLIATALVAVAGAAIAASAPAAATTAAAAPAAAPAAAVAAAPVVAPAVAAPVVAAPTAAAATGLTTGQIVGGAATIAAPAVASGVPAKSSTTTTGAGSSSIPSLLKTGGELITSGLQTATPLIPALIGQSSSNVTGGGAAGPASPVTLAPDQAAAANQTPGTLPKWIAPAIIGGGALLLAFLNS